MSPHVYVYRNDIKLFNNKCICINIKVDNAFIKA